MVVIEHVPPSSPIQNTHTLTEKEVISRRRLSDIEPSAPYNSHFQPTVPPTTLIWFWTLPTTLPESSMAPTQKTEFSFFFFQLKN